MGNGLRVCGGVLYVGRWRWPFFFFFLSHFLCPFFHLPAVVRKVGGNRCDFGSRTWVRKSNKIKKIKKIR